MYASWLVRLGRFVSPAILALDHTLSLSERPNALVQCNCDASILGYLCNIDPINP